MTLKELGKALEKKGLGGVSSTLSPIDPGTSEILQHYGDGVREAFRKGQEYLTEPRWNSSGSCPECGSKEYFDLFGGRCNKSCAKCKTAYDCISLEHYLERSELA
jgi:hypothetical protein